MMKRGHFSLSRTGAAIGIAIIFILLGFLQARQFEQASELRQRVDNSFETRAQIRAMLSLHQDVETGQRGFVLTGDKSFLEPYHSANPRLHPELARLKERLKGRPDLAGDMDRLTALTDQKIAFASRVIALRHQDRTDAAVRLIASGSGKALMDEIRTIVARMDRIERGQLRAATAEADASRQQIQVVTFALEAILLLMLLPAAWAVNRSLARVRSSAEELRNLSVRQQGMFDAVTDGMITHDPKGFIESLNPAACRMYGYLEEEIVGQNVTTLFHNPPEQRALEAFLAKLARNPDRHAASIQEFAGRRSDGEIFAVDVATNPVPLADGMHFIAIVRDVTERKRVETMKTEFVSTVSHELRTPLTSIAGSLGLLAGGAAGALPPRAAALIKIAHSNSERLVRLINDILDIEKIESGKMNFDIKPVPLVPLAEQVIQANTAYAEEYGVTLLLEGDDREAAALADPDRLVQVLTNLVSNASKFSPRGEEVLISIVPGKDSHRITVTDKGSGIPEEFKTRIFSKFAQADASDTREKGGTGLGLSIVKQIVTGLGGMISFDSEKGKGTAFHVDLPAASPALAAPARPRILICQEGGSAEEIGKSLQTAGFDSDIAESSQEVRRRVDEYSYAAVLLDLALPGEEAIDLIAHIRSDPRYTSTPVLIAASDGSAGDISQALAVVDWIHKPVSIEKLVQGLESTAANGGRPRILHIEDDPDVLRVVASAFEGHADVDPVTDLDFARLALKQTHYDLVILDLALPGGSGLELLTDMHRSDGTPIPVVIFSAQDDDPVLARRVEAMLTKSRASLNDLVATVETLLSNPRRQPSEEKA